MEMKTHDVAWDAALRKYRATCRVCGYSLTRSKREQAVWNISNHVNYSHDGKGVPA